MNIIDVNTMIGQWGPKKLHYSGAGGLLLEMDRLGIARALVYDSRSRWYDAARGNDLLLGQTRGNGRLVPVMAATPLLQLEHGGAEKFVTYIRENGIGAVRLFPDEQNFTLYPWNIGELLEILNAYRIPLMIECRSLADPLAAFWNNIREIMRAYPGVPVVLLTPGYRESRILYQLFEAGSNLHADTSTFIAYEGIEEVVRLFGAERLLFGSGMPFIEAGAALGRLLYAQISRQDMEKIAFGNIEAMLERKNAALAGGEARI